jgi:hypothetical protein
MLLRDIWDLFKLGQFDPNNRMIPLTDTKYAIERHLRLVQSGSV